MTPILLDTSFWDVVWWLIMAYFLVIIIWMFISVFADVFRRDDLNGFAKAGWVAGLILLPWISILLYFCFRPRLVTGSQQSGAVSQAAATEISKAHELLNSGAITQEEFERLKAQALA